MNFLTLFFCFRSDILAQYELKKKATDYMAAIQSRVAITTDLWISENQNRNYICPSQPILLMNLRLLEISS
jgi:hypothetical protein